jgi:hypothetical protein
MQSDDELRIRLEGAAELLEATLPRYRVLVRALDSFSWRDKLRRNLEVLGATARAQRAVDEALAMIRRKAEAERWAPGAILACAEEVRALRSRLRALVEARGGEAVTRVLADDLATLEREVVAAPRFVLPSERWALARQLLPADLPPVQAAARFGARAQALFSQPLEGSRLPAPEAFAEFKVAWRESLEALPALWTRLEGIDRSGGLVRSLKRRSLRLPRFTDAEKDDGPARLVHAQFWQTLAHLRMKQLVTERLEPVVPSTQEVMRVFSWLVRWQADAQASLAHHAIEPPRLALLELAARLRGSPSAPRTARPFERLNALATVADQNQVDDDWWRLRDSLTVVVRAASNRGTVLPPLFRSLEPSPTRWFPPQTLAALVMELEASFTR